MNLQTFLLLDECTSAVNYTAMNEERVRISIKNVNASWTENSIAGNLHNIDVLIPNGKLYALVGPVGAGKVFMFIFEIPRVPFFLGTILKYK